MIRVNSTAIPEEAILAEMQYHPANSQREAMLKAAESLIVSELLRQRAIALQFEVDDTFGTAADDYNLDALIMAEVAIPTATDEECQQFYNANPKRFTTAPILTVRHILLAAAPDDDEGRVAMKAKAEDIINALQQGADFGALARRHSACPSLEAGGGLGQISRGQTVPEFERQLFPASPGLLPRPIESRYGYHVVDIEHKTPGVLLPFEEVNDEIRSYLNAKVGRKAIAQYIQTLIAAADIEGFSFDVSASPLMQ